MKICNDIFFNETSEILFEMDRLDIKHRSNLELIELYSESGKIRDVSDILRKEEAVYNEAVETLGDKFNKSFNNFMDKWDKRSEETNNKFYKKFGKNHTVSLNYDGYKFIGIIKSIGRSLTKLEDDAENNKGSVKFDDKYLGFIQSKNNKAGKMFNDGRDENKIFKKIDDDVKGSSTMNTSKILTLLTTIKRELRAIHDIQRNIAKLKNSEVTKLVKRAVNVLMKYANSFMSYLTEFVGSYEHDTVHKRKKTMDRTANNAQAGGVVAGYAMGS